MVAWIEGRPIPWPRPRVNRKTGVVWTPSNARKHKALIAARLSESMHDHRREVGFNADRFSVLIEFCGARATADLDNLAKTVLDAATGVVWHDDRQVDTLLVQRTEPDPDGARGTGIKIVRHLQEDK